jgi:hypothetical protein
MRIDASTKAATLRGLAIPYSGSPMKQAFRLVPGPNITYGTKWPLAGLHVDWRADVDLRKTANSTGLLK